MKLKQLIKDKDFQNARLIIYIILFISYIYLAYFSNFQCEGCQLCGMTRAVKSLLRLDFKSAFEFNSMVWIFCILIPVIVMDIICIFKMRYKRYKNFNKK